MRRDAIKIHTMELGHEQAMAFGKRRTVCWIALGIFRVDLTLHLVIGNRTTTLFLGWGDFRYPPL
jgi:hypothetical protein